MLQQEDNETFVDLWRTFIQKYMDNFSWGLRYMKSGIFILFSNLEIYSWARYMYSAVKSRLKWQ